jgi:hypothetical protein
MSLYPSNLYEEKLNNGHLVSLPAVCMTVAPISISIFIRICTFIQMDPGS